MGIIQFCCMKSILTIILLTFITNNTLYTHSIGLKASSKDNQKLTSSGTSRYMEPHTHNTSEDPNNIPLNNLTIEVLPNDDEEDDGFLQFGLLRDAYGYGESLKTIGSE
ncbi:hypothetical protein BEWA_019800 [Theileria equi strain WA]|uniref:Microprotein domain-containing protein n=1 Tax=Theileria equi strain WA TaxID=1537102 RepID=L0AW57_THEEQ|nr:hypothetical protein BEWA_019800 [Theileria equi strain WA]AFZ79134.1 hypothetical protein BEWA_019800 [Theileria equi strain WA]|eukprot:XP_004828800.1 hypothetical protein BEWA_019800 [Theileria equi strain WA]